MFCCSKYRWGAFGFVILLATACAPRRASETGRKVFDPLDQKQFSPENPINLNAADDELLKTYFEEPADSATAKLGPCAWLDSYPQPKLAEARFRMASNLALKMQGGRIEVTAVGSTTNGAVSKNTSPDLLTEAPEQPSDVLGQVAVALGLAGSPLQKLFVIAPPKNSAPEKAVENFLLSGRIDLGANQVLQFGLADALHEAWVNGEILDRQGYLAKLDREMGEKNFFVEQPIERLKQLFLSLGFGDFYKLRNQQLAKIITSSLPGVFDDEAVTGRKLYSLSTILPKIIFDNAMSDYSAVLPQLSEPAERTRLKIFRLQRILKYFEKPVPLFTGSSWKSYERDSRISLNLALKGLASSETDEQACGAVLLNRSLSQLLTFLGFNRTPVIQNSDMLTSHLPPVADLLDFAEGSTLRSCPVPGVFAQNGIRKLLTKDSLPDAGDQDFDLPAEIPQPTTCDARTAPVEGSWDHLHYPRFYIGDKTDADGWIALLSSLGHFMTAFNPGAPWWSERGLPLMNASNLEKASGTGGLLPFQAHALALGFLNLGAAQLQKRHLVQVDGKGFETTKTSDTLGIRIALEPRVVGAKDAITTTLYSATVVAETAFEFAPALKRLAEWQTKSDLARKQYAYEPDTKTRDKKIAYYNDLMKGMFGSTQTLSRLTSDAPNSLRKTLEDLRLASAALLARFVRQSPDGRYHCYNALENNLATGAEAQVGACTEKEEARFKRVLGIIAKSFQSPLFARYAER